MSELPSITDLVSRWRRAQELGQTPSLDERVKALGRQVGGEDKARKMFIERQPMGRLGTAEEMAHIAVYLASDESVYTTGSAMLSDGGFTL